MTREDVKKLFPDASDEAVTELLNKTNSEIAKEKSKAEKLKADFEDLKASAANADELQKKIDEMEQAQMSEVDKVRKELEAANGKIAEFEKKDIIRTMREEAMENYKISAEQAKKVVKDDGKYDAVVLGQIISEKESASATAKEQEIANAASNPGGSSNSGGNAENSIAKTLAIASAKRAGVANNDILDHYRR